MEFMQNVVFRSAHIEDTPQLIKLRILMLCETNKLAENPSTPEFESTARSYFEEGLQNKSYFCAVAVLNNEVISTSGLVLYRKPPSFNSATGMVGYITNVYTLPQFRKNGIASQLIEIVIEHAKSSGAVKLHLGSTEDGKNLYEKAGFKDVKFPALELKILGLIGVKFLAPIAT